MFKRLAYALVFTLLAFPAFAQNFPPQVPISMLPPGGPMQTSDLFPATRSGITYGVTWPPTSIPFSVFPSQPANIILGTIAIGPPAPLSISGCNTTEAALTWTNNVGFGCHFIPTNTMSSLLGATTTNNIDNAAWNQTWTWNSLTTGTALEITSSSGTSGTVFAAELTTSGNNGYAGYFQNTATGTTGYAVYAAGAENVTGSLSAFTFNASPGALTGSYKIDGVSVLSYPSSDIHSLSLGYGALQSQSVSSANNVGVGYEAGAGLTSGGNNTAVGYDALGISTTGVKNTVIGASAGTNITVGTINTILGYASGTSLSTGSSNVIIGPNVASTTLTTGSNNILIGTSSAVDTTTGSASNFVNLANLYEGNTSSKHSYYGGGLASVTSGATDCGTSPSISGNDNVGSVMVGTTPSGVCHVVFANAWTNAPDTCFCTDNTSAARGCSALSITTTEVALTATTSPFTGGDSLGYFCPTHQP